VAVVVGFDAASDSGRRMLSIGRTRRGLSFFDGDLLSEASPINASPKASQWTFLIGS
jgi:hypothetical protein